MQASLTCLHKTVVLNSLIWCRLGGSGEAQTFWFGFVSLVHRLSHRTFKQPVFFLFVSHYTLIFQTFPMISANFNADVDSQAKHTLHIHPQI